MFNIFEVWFWAKMWCSEVFEVWSYCYVTRLVLELTIWCSRTVQFFVMFDMFEVWFWTKMWCSESSMFGHSRFRVFEVRYYDVCSKTSMSLKWQCNSVICINIWLVCIYPIFYQGMYSLNRKKIIIGISKSNFEETRLAAICMYYLM